VNLIVGFLSLFPGLFESGVSDGTPAGQGILALLGTRYGLYAIALLGGAAVQTTCGSYLNVLLRSKQVATPLLATLGGVSIGLETWSYFLKGYGTIFALPGVAAGVACLFLLVSRRRGAA
jgi:hypothetical protein